MSSNEISRLTLLGRKITDLGKGNVSHALYEVEKDVMNGSAVAVLFDENDASKSNDERLMRLSY